MNINRRAIILLSIVLTACAGQNPPIISTLEENTTTGQPSATPSTELLPPVSATKKPPDTNSIMTPNTRQAPASTPISTLESISTVFIPDTGQTQIPPNTVIPDKFQIDIPIKGGDGLIGLLPTTGFPPGLRTRIKINKSPNSDLITPTLVIPSLEINIPILGIELRNGTWDVSWLWDQAGWLEETAYPTRNGNSVLTAHVVTADGKNGPFAHLKTLTVDDYVFIYNSGFRYIYKVDSINYVKPDNLSVFSHEDDSWLTLITCDSYDEEKGVYLLRVVVRTRLVEVQEME